LELYSCYSRSSPGRSGKKGRSGTATVRTRVGLFTKKRKLFATTALLVNDRQQRAYSTKKTIEREAN